MRAADRVLVLADSETAAAPPGAGGFEGCEVIALGDDVPVAAGAAVTHRLTGASDAAGLERLARRVAGRSVGIVLSGGGARALAHVGALAAVEGAGVTIDRVGACSMGTVPGSLYAAGHTPTEIHATINRLDPVEIWRRHGADGDFAMRVGRAVAAECPRLVRDLYTVSVDLLSGAQRVHRGEPLAQMIAASVALPAITSPARVDGRLLIDGAMLDPLPVDLMHAEGDGPIIAVDVSGRSARMEKWISRWQDPDAEPPTPMDVSVQALDLASIEAHARARHLADLLIEPVAPFGTLAFHRVDEIVETGREACEGALAAATEAQRERLAIG